MNILLLGADGQVGQALRQTLPMLGPVHACTRADVDLSDAPALRRWLAAQEADLIVNAAAWTAVDLAETREREAHAVNADAVAILAEHARRRGARLLHYSTDYVFDGAQTRPYREDDTPAPSSVYGRTKLAGEAAIRASGCDALVLRVSWVVSATGHNFVKTVLRLATEHDSLRIVDDQHGAPTSAALIAETTVRALRARAEGRLPGSLYHLSAAGETSWCGLARHVIERAHALGANLRTRPDAVAAIATQDYPLPARRPANSRLDSSALAHALGVRLPPWRVGVDAIVDQLLHSERPQ